VVQVKDPHERYATLVGEYAALSPEDRDKTLVITGTNDSRKKMNEAIQESLGLRGKGQTYELLNRLDTTQAERRHSRYYEKGAVILPERDYSNGLKRGEQYTVLDTGPGNQLTVRGQDGEVIRFSPARFNRLSVYSREKTELAVGDQVRITRNDADKDLANGDRFTVKSVTQDQVLLAGKEGREITLEANKPMFAGLAYVPTVHSAQGLTSDRVLINIETKSRTTTKDVYYVGISRARHEGVIYTDNHKALSKAISRDSLKTAALELKHRKMQGRAHDQRGRELRGRDVSREAPRQKQPQIGL
jgi:ATP-dependent exoDNAse (exonuclease V) alpha subunit